MALSAKIQGIIKKNPKASMAIGLFLLAALSGGIAKITDNAKTDAGKRLHDRMVEVNATTKASAVTKVKEVVAEARQ